MYRPQTPDRRTDEWLDIDGPMCSQTKGAKSAKMVPDAHLILLLGQLERSHSMSAITTLKRPIH